MTREAIRAQRQLTEAVSRSEDYARSDNLAMPYVMEHVCPPLEKALKYVCAPIEEEHRVASPERPEDDYVVHYTSMAALVSMLQDATEERLRGKKALWRLYDSFHLNDPDEGTYFDRSLNLQERYSWLKKEHGDVTHAYIASFVLPNAYKTEEDVSNSLLFWRAYGREGEGCSLRLPIQRSLLQRVLYGSDRVKNATETLRSLLDPLLDSVEPFGRDVQTPPFVDGSKRLSGTLWRDFAIYTRVKHTSMRVSVVLLLPNQTYTTSRTLYLHT